MYLPLTNRFFVCHSVCIPICILYIYFIQMLSSFSWNGYFIICSLIQQASTHALFHFSASFRFYELYLVIFFVMSLLVVTIIYCTCYIHTNKEYCFILRENTVFTPLPLLILDTLFTIFKCKKCTLAPHLCEKWFQHKHLWNIKEHGDVHHLP